MRVCLDSKGQLLLDLDGTIYTATVQQDSLSLSVDDGDSWYRGLTPATRDPEFSRFQTRLRNAERKSDLRGRLAVLES